MPLCAAVAWGCGLYENHIATDFNDPRPDKLSCHEFVTGTLRHWGLLADEHCPL
jgi:hypothetical protein